ncbi:MAG: ABC transporter permease [Rhodobacterales bacterium 17-64-5]|nr:MAG: ABC transporter permease [Rhodobacterales bacterium 17-64-5]
MTEKTSTGAPTRTISDYEATLARADTAVASFERDDKTIVHLLRNFLRRNPTMIPALILVLSVLIFGLIESRFLGMGALSTVMKQVTVTGFIALAQTLIILTAGIDLSVGAILVVSSLVMGSTAVTAGVPLPTGFGPMDLFGLSLPFGLTFERFILPVPLAVALGIFVGGVMGMLNGLLVVKAKLPPFIVTLGTLSIFEALKLWYSASESVRNVDIVEKAPGLLWFGEGIALARAKDPAVIDSGLVITGFGEPKIFFMDTTEFLGVAQLSWGVFMLIILAAVLWYVLNHTAWGRHVHAIGDDPDAAMLSGIQVGRTLISVYTVAGLICGFAAWIAIGRVGSISPIAFADVNLASITAVVIGGTSLFGGRGSIIGSVLGAMIVGVFITGLSLAGVDDYWQKFAAGCLVIIAVALDQWLRRASQ